MQETQKIGILGGGQLALMLAQAADRLKIPVGIYEAEKNSPAHNSSAQITNGKVENCSVLKEWIKNHSFITFENEFIDTSILQAASSTETIFYPALSTLDLVQDKFFQKKILSQQGLSVPSFSPIESIEKLTFFIEKNGYPFVLKERKNGYDGKGTYLIKNEHSFCEWIRNQNIHPTRLYAESYIPFKRELAIQVSRSSNGEISLFPIVETIQLNGICHLVFAPAQNLSPKQIEKIHEIATQTVNSLKYVGLLAIELFEGKEGEILINELAPRVHNSGHYTIEGCETSQFTQHLLAILGRPLGSTKLQFPTVMMLNVLGEFKGEYRLEGIERLPTSCKLHWYEKKECREGRKMGHLTAWGENFEETSQIIELARKELKICKKES